MRGSECDEVLIAKFRTCSEFTRATGRAAMKPIPLSLCSAAKTANFLLLVPIHHALAQNSRYSIGCRPRTSDHLEKTLRRNSALVSAFQIDRRKPFGQRQTRMLENRSRHRRNLATTQGVLVQMRILQLHLKLSRQNVQSDHCIAL